MPALADEPGPLGLVEVPAAGPEPPGVDQVAQRDRLADLAEATPEVEEAGREAPVEPDHQAVVAGAGHRLLDARQLLVAERQRLLDVDRLAALESGADEVGVGAVPGGHEHGVEAVVLDHRPGLGAGGLEAEGTLGVDARQRPCRGDPDQRDVVGGGQAGQQHRRGVAAGADDAQAHRAVAGPGPPGGAGSGGARGVHADRSRAVPGRVGQQVADPGDPAGAQPLVDLRRLGDRVVARDERCDVEGAVGQQREEAGDVALLGPAHVAQRVVDAVELVAVVVAARAVGAREPDVELLLVVGVPGQVEARLADVDDAGPVASQPRGELDGLVARPARGQEDVVGAPRRPGPQQRLEPVHPRRVGPGAAPGAALLGGAAALLDGVEAHHPDPRSDQQPHQQLADQAQPDDAGGLPQLHLRPAQRLHRDGTDRGEGGVLGEHPVGHPHAEVARHPVDLGVQRELVARCGDQVTDLEAVHALPDLHDHAAQRVAQGRPGVEPVAGLAVGRHRTVLGDRVEHLAHLVGTVPRLRQQRHPRLGDLHQLGAGRDQRVRRAHQHPAGPAGGHGCLEHRELTGAVVLGHVPHPRLLVGSLHHAPPVPAPTPAPRALRSHSSRLSSW